MEIAISFLAAWASYLAAEAVGASGVLATVTCGLWTGWRQHTVFSAQTRLEARATWSFIVFVLEAMVFILIGLSLRGVLDRLGARTALGILPLAAEITLAAIVVRFVWVMFATYVPRWIIPGLGARDPAPPVAVASIVAWAGMRGVVSLAVALALPAGFPGRDLILYLTFVLILVTVLIQGTTLGPLIKALGVDTGDDGKDRMIEARARASMRAAQLAVIEEQSRDVLNGAIAQDMLAEFRDLVQEASMFKHMSAAIRAERAARLSLRLDSLEAARNHALRQNRAGELHDEILLKLEHELDFEELRLREDLRGLG